MQVKSRNCVLFMFIRLSLFNHRDCTNSLMYIITLLHTDYSVYYFKVKEGEQTETDFFDS